MILCLIITAAVIALDQLTKYLVVQNIPLGESSGGIPGIFRLTYVENKGAAFSMLADRRWVFMAVSCIAIVAIAVYLIVKKPKSVLLRSGLAMVLGGGIGNMIDRVARGSVIDFVDLRFMNFYIFNVADIFVTVGCVVLLAWLIFVDTPAQKKANAAGSGAVDAARASHTEKTTACRDTGNTGSDGAAVPQEKSADTEASDTEDVQTAHGEETADAGEKEKTDE